MIKILEKISKLNDLIKWLTSTSLLLVSNVILRQNMGFNGKNNIWQKDNLNKAIENQSLLILYVLWIQRSTGFG